MHKLFPSQREDEHIYIVVREHWFRLVLKLGLWLFFVGVLLLFRYYGPTAIPGLFLDTPGVVTHLFIQVYMMFLGLSLFIIWLLYYLNIQIVTNMRIVDIDQVGLFSHTIAELHIENIEDVTSETIGVFGTVFNYGNVYVQTAGTKERFEFENIPNPAMMEKLVLDLYEQAPDKNYK